ncbi:hypothetical protein BD560DRAFT_432384 [Blakeslea trispora]|nr:hypothetical protein BD560DRAFT_432384 [Blakeslea trispora]
MVLIPHDDLRSTGFQTFIHALRLPISDPSFTSFSVARLHFKAAVSKAATQHFAAQSLGSASAWLAFWRLALTSVQRNATYRFIVGKIPTRLLLHRLALPSIADPLCVSCQEEETLYHFFFRCPQKFIYWDAVIREFLWPSTTIDIIAAAYKSLNFNSISTRPSCPLPPELLLPIVLSELWKAHWAHVHQRLPFLAEMVFRQTLWRVHRHAAEDSSLLNNT